MTMHGSRVGHDSVDIKKETSLLHYNSYFFLLDIGNYDVFSYPILGS